MTDAAPSPNDRLPVSILTGFLGSGKTTVLSKLIRHENMDRVAVIVNEFGEVGLDDALVEKVDEETVMLNSGCVCCTVRGDLVDTLRKLYLQRSEGVVREFDRVVIETTGLADPAPILHTMMSDPFIVGRFRLDGVVTSVDAVNAGWQFDKQFESIKQAAVADRIILTKTDLVDAERISSVTARLQDLNPSAPVIKSEMGEVDPDELFNAGLYNPMTKSVDVAQWLREEAYRDTEGHVYTREHEHEHGHDHHGHSHDVNRHDEHIQSFCLFFDEPFKWQKIASALDLLSQSHGQNLLRLKGLLNVEEADGPVVVHAIQHMFHPPAKLNDWPDEDRRSRIVMIMRDMDEKTMQSVFNSYLALEF